MRASVAEELARAASAERLRRIFGDDGDARIAYVATPEEAERLHDIATLAGRSFLYIVDPRQTGSIADGGTIKDMMARVAMHGASIHDVPRSDQIDPSYVWRPTPPGPLSVY